MIKTLHALRWIPLLLISPPLIAQQGKLEVVGASSKELKRTAYHLHISTERLKNARQALQEATDLARRTQKVPVQHFYQLAEAWIQLNRPRADTAIAGLLSTLSTAAQAATDAAAYREATNAAQGLITSLAQIDSEKSAQWSRQWPAPPASLGPQAQALADSMQQQLRTAALQRLVFSDPQAALKMLSEGSASGAGDYSMRGTLMLQLMQRGNAEQAGNLVDRTVTEFAAAKSAPAAWYSYTNFLSQLPQVAPERFLDAFQLWAKNAPAQLLSTAGSALQVGETNILLDANEAAAMNVLRSVGNRPELMMRALDSMPSLKAKLDQAGGLDKALNGAYGMPPTSYYRSPDGSVRAVRSEADTAAPSKMMDELRGQAAKNPQLVRSRLSSMVKEPEDVALLLQLAMMSIWEDPDLASLAVEVARPIVLRIQPAARQLPLFQQLLRTMRQSEGEIDSALIKEGFVLADELRQNKTEQPYARQSGYAPADQLETVLLSELARDDFDAAIRYVHSMESDQQKIGALMGIVQGSRQPY